MVIIVIVVMFRCFGRFFLNDLFIIRVFVSNLGVDNIVIFTVVDNVC